jgi:hypothetical protein
VRFNWKWDLTRDGCHANARVVDGQDLCSNRSGDLAPRNWRARQTAPQKDSAEHERHSTSNLHE